MESDFRDRPIPGHAHPPTALDYKNVPVDWGDRRSSEALVDPIEWGIAAHGYYARTDGLNAPYHRGFASASERVFCRRSVAERLSKANERLLPLGVELFVLNGYRSLELQKELWDFFIQKEEKASTIRPKRTVSRLPGNTAPIRVNSTTRIPAPGRRTSRAEPWT